MKKLFPALFICIVFCAALAAPAFALTLEQVQASPPRFDVYVYDEGADLSSVGTSDITATLGDTSLDCVDVSRSEQGIFYYFMLDVSASIPESYFEAAKTAVLDTYSTLRDQDKLAVITFGNDVTLLLSGDESKEDVTSAISSLSCCDNNTMFYTAMDKLIEVATQTQDMRRIAVVISDGIDDSDAGMTQSELEDKLTGCGISVYALCIDSASDIDNFGDFIRLSGGELYTFGPDNAESVLNELLSRLSDSLHIELLSTSSISTDESLSLNISVGDFGSISTELSPDEWLPDETAPYIESATYSLTGKTLDIVFSEPVSGADDLDNYTLLNSDGKEVDFQSAEYTAADRTAVSLSFSTLPVDGQYTLSVEGIKDISTAQNDLHPYNSTVLLATGVTEDSASSGGLSKDIITYIVVGIIAIILITFLAIAILKMSKTDAKNKDDGGKLNAEDKKKLKKAERESKHEEKFIFANKESDPIKSCKKDDGKDGKK